MSTQVQIVIVVFSLLLLGFIFELLRRKKISEAMVLWWLSIIVLMIFLAINQSALGKIREIMGTAFPISALLLFSLGFILIMLVYFSMKISVLSNQVKDIAQEFAIFKVGVYENQNKKEN